MTGSPLDGAIISSEQIIKISHPLAATNHRQWAAWEGLVLRESEASTSEAADIIERAQAGGLDSILSVHAQMVVGIVSHTVGEFAYQPDLSMVVARKREQFVGWVHYAITRMREDRHRWLLQCRTPFLVLPSDMQASDYVEAGKDLQVVARSGGLVLTEPLPELSPQSPEQLKRARARHSLGMHGAYLSCERPWTNICVGCHHEWPISY